jgi:hypothetical protein
MSLDDADHSTKMDAEAAASDFFGDLGGRYGREGSTVTSLGAQCGLAPHLHMVWVVASVPTEICNLLLGAGRR